MRKASWWVMTTCLIAAGPLAAQQPEPIAPPIGGAPPPAEFINPPLAPPSIGGPPPAGYINPALAPPAPVFVGFIPPADNWNSRVWVRTEYLLWWVKAAPAPVPLVTTGDPNDPIPGAINQPNTQVLLGNQNIGYGTFSGLRFGLGFWIDPNRIFGIDTSFFSLERLSNDYFFSSDGAGNPLLAVPVNSNTPGAGNQGERAIPITSPGVFTGNIDVNTSLQLWGTEVNGVFTLLRDSNRRFELTLLAGFRYVDLQENLSMSSFSNDITSTPNTVSTFNDSFNTRNQFYGGQLGTHFFWQGDRMSLDLAAKLALGATHQIVDIQGYSSTFGPNANVPGTFPGGILTQPSNSNRYTANQFTVLPSLEMKVGYQLTPHTRLFVGYDFLYWNQVVRPGNQIDRTLNATQSSTILNTPTTLVGPASPMPQFNRSDFWAQGVTFGLEFKF